jgi:hypothetical protein
LTLDQLSCLTNLKTLRMNGLADLKSLRLRITDGGLAHLKNLNQLNYLDLSVTHVGDADVVHLYRLLNLERLVLYKTQVSEDGLATLRSSLPNCMVFADK